MSHREDNDGHNDYDIGHNDNQTESAENHIESEESQAEPDLGANMKIEQHSLDSKNMQQCSSDGDSINSPNGREALNGDPKPEDGPRMVTHTSYDKLATHEREQNPRNAVGNIQENVLHGSHIPEKPHVDSAAGTGCTPKKIDSCTGCYKETARALCIQCNLWLSTECHSRHQTRKDALAHTVLQREAVQICLNHSRPCWHFSLDCQDEVCLACTLENCSSHTTRDISWTLDEIRHFLAHHESLIDKYFQYIRQRQNIAFDDAKRAVIVQTGTLISTLLKRSRALEEELECARVKSLSLLGRQEDAYNATLHRFLTAMPQTPADGIPVELLDLLPSVNVIPETSMTSVLFQPRHNLNLGHLDIFKQPRDPIMLGKLPQHPCCDVINALPYPVDTNSVPPHQKETKVCTAEFRTVLCTFIVRYRSVLSTPVRGFMCTYIPCTSVLYFVMCTCEMWFWMPLWDPQIKQNVNPF